MSNDFEITELNRRLANLIRLGVIDRVDHASARVRVKIGDLLTAWLPWATIKAGKDSAWWAPEKGEQVLVFSPSGDLAQGVVLGAIFQNAFPGLGPAVGATSKTPTYTVDGDLMVTGNVRVVGDLTVSGTVGLAGGHGTPIGVVTGECICHFTGSPHGDISTNVEASK